MQPIPGWPQLQSLWAPIAYVGYGSSTTANSYEELEYIDTTGREMRQWSISRGRQFELDKTQTGTLTTTWDDRDGHFDPLNTAGPYADALQPYQPYRLRARYPGTANLLTTDQATAGQGSGWPTGPVPAQLFVTSAGGYSVTLAYAADAYYGTQVYQVAIPSGSTSPNDLLNVSGTSVIPGQTYTAQIQARMLGTAQTINVHVSMNWLDAGGVTVLSTKVGGNVALVGGSSTWQQISVTGSAPAGAVTVMIRAVLGTTSTASAQLQVSALMLTQAPAPLPFALPGATQTNLLTVDKATAGLGTPWAAGSPPGVWGIDGRGYVSTGEWQSVVPSVTPASGASAYETTVTESAAFTILAESNEVGPLVFLTREPVTAGQPYSFQMQVRSTTSGQSPVMLTIMDFRGTPFSPGAVPSSSALQVFKGGTQTLTGGANAPWTTLTVSGTAPAGASFVIIGVSFGAVVSASTTVQSASWQLEPNPLPSAYSTPAPWFDLITGGVERYPGKSEYIGLLGERAPTIVDSFALLSQSQLQDPVVSVVMTPPNGGAAPSLFYPLAEPSGATVFSDLTGQRAGMQAVASKFGAGTITPGTAQTSASPSGGFQGSPGATVTHFTSSAAAGTDVYGQPMSWLEVPANAAGVRGPGAGTAKGFTRMIAFRCTAVPTTESALWNAQDGTGNYRVAINLFINPQQVGVAVNDLFHFGFTNVGAYDVGNWHLAWVGVSSDGTSYIAGVDGSITSFAITNGLNIGLPFATDRIAAEVPNIFQRDGNLQTAQANFQGDIAFIAEWPFEMNQTQVTAIYEGWKTAWAGDSSGDRYIRILQLAGWTGPAIVDEGVSQNLGPATTISGQDALSALQDIVSTEAGNHFVRGDGVIVFRARSHRWGVNTPTVTFGENVVGGEIAYEGDYATDFDPTHVTNSAQITQSSTGQVYQAGDPTGASQNRFGTRTIQITSLSADPAECQAQAQYLVSRYKGALVRYSSLTVDPAGQIAAWPVLLGLDLDTRVRVMHRPPAGYVTQVDGWVENIKWAGDDKGTARAQYQISPVDPSPYVLLQAMHTTLAAPLAYLGTSMTLNALADAATSRAECSFYVGQVLTIQPGGVSGSVTVTSVPSTVVGYSTFTLGISPSPIGVSAGVTVCEALSGPTTSFVYAGATYAMPSPTDPTTWDLSATPYGVMDKGVFAF